MFNLKISSLIFLTLCVATSFAVDCINHDEFDGKCYFFSRDFNLQETWVNAQEYCFDLSTSILRYDLASISSVTAEYKFLADHMEKGGYTEMHVGATDVGFNDGQWTWTDGSYLSLENPMWGNGYPCSSYSSYDCGTLLARIENTLYGTYRIHLTDNSCYTSEYFVCEGTPVGADIPEEADILEEFEQISEDIVEIVE